MPDAWRGTDMGQAASPNGPHGARRNSLQCGEQALLGLQGHLSRLC